MLRRGKDLRCILEDIAGESRVDHARIFDIVVGEDPPRDKKNGEDDPQDRQSDGRGKESLLNMNAQNVAPEGWTFIVSQDEALGKAEFSYTAPWEATRE